MNVELWTPFLYNNERGTCWVYYNNKIIKSESLDGLPTTILEYFGRWWEWLGFRRKITDDCNQIVSKEPGVIKKDKKMVPVWHVVSKEFKKGTYSRELVKKIDCGNSEWYLVEDYGLMLIINGNGSCGCVACEEVV